MKERDEIYGFMFCFVGSFEYGNGCVEDRLYIYMEGLGPTFCSQKRVNLATKRKEKKNLINQTTKVLSIGDQPLSVYKTIYLAIRLLLAVYSFVI